MRRAAVLLVGLGMVWGLVGCSGPQMAKESSLIARYAHRAATQSSTMTQSSAEHLHSLNSVVDLDQRALLDDLDLLWQRERGTRLSRWYGR